MRASVFFVTVAWSDSSREQPVWVNDCLVGRTRGGSLAPRLRDFSLQRAHHEGLSRSNRGGWHSRYLQSSEDTVLGELWTEVEALARVFVEGRAPAPSSFQLRLSSLWANVHRRGDTNVAHRHAVPGVEGDDVPTISGVYYASSGGCPETCSRLRIFADEAFGNSSDIDPEPDRVVLFPASNLHEVVSASNESEFGEGHLRISLAFNIVVRVFSSLVHEAASLGDMHLLRQQALADSLEDVGADGWTPVHHAAENGHVGVVSHLAGRATNVDRRTHGRSSAIHLAATVGHRAVVELLVSLGVDAGSPGPFGFAPAHIAAANEDLLLLGHLSSLSADLEARSDDGSTPLHSAVKNGHMSVTAFLLDQHANVDAADQTGFRPLHEAARGGLLSLFDMLVRRGARLDLKDTEGRGTSFWAAHGGHSSVLERLVPDIDFQESVVLSDRAQGKEEVMAEYLAAAMIGRGGEFSVKASDSTLLHTAAAEGHASVVQWLVSHRADVNSCARGSRARALHVAASQGHEAVVEWLLLARARVTDEARGRLQPMHLAAHGGNTKVVAHLLSASGSVVARAADGGHPLHIAAVQGHVHVMEQLVTSGAIVGARTLQAQQPLLRAVEAGHAGAVEYLLEQRADQRVRDRDGVSPADVAASTAHAEVVHLMRRWMVADEL